MAKTDAEVQQELDRTDRLYLFLSRSFDGIPAADVMYACAMLIAEGILQGREQSGKTTDEYLAVFCETVKLEMQNPLIAKPAGNA